MTVAPFRPIIAGMLPAPPSNGAAGGARSRTRGTSWRPVPPARLSNAAVARTCVLAGALLLAGCAGREADDEWTGLNSYTRALTDPADMRAGDWTDPAEAERAWRAAPVRIPRADGTILRAAMAEVEEGAVGAEGVHPTVIFAHGSTGLGAWSAFRLDLLARAGYAVIAPASFARRKYPRSSRPETLEGNLYRPTLAMRLHDLRHAVRRAKALPWVDGGRMALVGLSEGGILAAVFQGGPGESVRARIVEGWTCNNAWPEYRGVNAPPDEPVLALLGAEDPWYRPDGPNPSTRGDCGPFLDPVNGSRSVVYTEPPLSGAHGLLRHEGPRRLALGFLDRHVRGAGEGPTGR